MQSDYRKLPLPLIGHAVVGILAAAGFLHLPRFLHNTVGFPYAELVQIVYTIAGAYSMPFLILFGYQRALGQVRIGDSVQPERSGMAAAILLIVPFILGLLGWITIFVKVFIAYYGLGALYFGYKVGEIIMRRTQ